MQLCDLTCNHGKKIDEDQNICCYLESELSIHGPEEEIPQGPIVGPLGTTMYLLPIVDMRGGCKSDGYIV